MAEIRRLTGRILMAQESRFRLVAPSGQTALLTLAPGAGLDEAELLGLVESQRTVVAEFRGQPEEGSGLVTRLFEAATAEDAAERGDG